MRTPGPTYAPRPMLQSRPSAASSRIWARCQTRVPVADRRRARRRRRSPRRSRRRGRASGVLRPPGRVSAVTADQPVPDGRHRIRPGAGRRLTDFRHRAAGGRPCAAVACTGHRIPPAIGRRARRVRPRLASGVAAARRYPDRKRGSCDVIRPRRSRPRADRRRRHRRRLLGPQPRPQLPGLAGLPAALAVRPRRRPGPAGARRATPPSGHRRPRRGAGRPAVSGGRHRHPGRHPPDVALAALRAGKHVLVEKPLAATYAEGRRAGRRGRASAA